ncbi:MAG: hypothetical protein BYD32DRAFT_262284 [Podila humilis]|nr:MAG: hypothetical protein BYD32DRAFT_262284 [Podila humilis]
MVTSVSHRKGLLANKPPYPCQLSDQRDQHTNIPTYHFSTTHHLQKSQNRKITAKNGKGALVFLSDGCLPRVLFFFLIFRQPNLDTCLYRLLFSLLFSLYHFLCLLFFLFLYLSLSLSPSLFLSLYLSQA